MWKERKDQGRSETMFSVSLLLVFVQCSNNLMIHLLNKCLDTEYFIDVRNNVIINNLAISLVLTTFR